MAPMQTPKEQAAAGNPPGITNIAVQLPEEQVEQDKQSSVKNMHRDLLAVMAIADLFGRLGNFQ